jgi:PAS domain S-box-containing protein
MTFGQRLKALRQAKGMTQGELAKKTAISSTYVSKLETGVISPPRQKIILALAKALGVNKSDTDELFGLARKMPPDLLANIDTGMIKTWRSLKKSKETPVRELAVLQRRVTEPETSDTQDTRLKELPGRQKDIFRALIETFPDGIVVLGSELEVIYENPSISRILGYEPGEFIGKDTFAVIHPDDMSRVAHRLTTMIHNPDDTSKSHAQCRVRHKDGTWRVVDAVANNLLHDPIVKGIVIVIHKVSRRSRDERELAEEAAAALAMAKKYHLTESEYRVLTLVAEGQSNPQIAEKLVVSPSTVRFHVTSILRKLGVTNRTEAATIAVRCHLVD